MYSVLVVVNTKHSSSLRLIFLSAFSLNFYGHAVPKLSSCSPLAPVGFTAFGHYGVPDLLPVLFPALPPGGPGTQLLSAEDLFQTQHQVVLPSSGPKGPSVLALNPDGLWLFYFMHYRGIAMPPLMRNLANPQSRSQSENLYLNVMLMETYLSYIV